MLIEEEKIIQEQEDGEESSEKTELTGINVELDEGDIPVDVQEEPDSDWENKVIEENNLSIDWDAIEFEDKDKKIPALSEEDIEKIVSTGYADYETIRNMVDTSRMMLRIHQSNSNNENDEIDIFEDMSNDPVGEDGLTESQRHAKCSLAHLQILARTTITNVKSKENIILSTNFNCIREILSRNFEYKYGKNKEAFTTEEQLKILEKGFFGNFYNTLVEFDEEELKKKIKGKFFKLLYMENTFDGYYNAIGVLKKMIDGQKFTFLSAGAKIDKLIFDFENFNSLFMNLTINKEPSLDKESAAILSDPDSNLSSSLANLEKTGMFVRDDIDKLHENIEVCKMYFESKDKFVNLFKSKTSYDKMMEWLKALQNSWGSDYQRYRNKTKLSVEELADAFGMLTLEEKFEVQSNPNAVKKEPKLDDYRKFNWFKRQQQLLEGTAYIGSVLSNKGSLSSVYGFFDYLATIVTRWYLYERLEEFMFYDPTDEYDEEEAFDKVFEESWEGKKEDWKEFKSIVKTKYNMNRNINMYTRSFLKNAIIDNVYFTLQMMEEIEPKLNKEHAGNKLERIKAVLGDYYLEDSFINYIYLILDKKAGFDCMMDAERRISKVVYSIMHEIFTNEEKLDEFIKANTPLPQVKRKKKLSKKERTKLKKKNNKK